jgi:hypothetical protein
LLFAFPAVVCRYIPKRGKSLGNLAYWQPPCTFYTGYNGKPEKMKRRKCIQFGGKNLKMKMKILFEVFAGNIFDKLNILLLYRHKLFSLISTPEKAKKRNYYLILLGVLFLGFLYRMPR